ncbi:MAG: helix-turn-helix domain-containing protein [bacterium]
MENIKDYLTIKQVLELLGVDKTTLRCWDKAGKLKPYRNPLNKYRLYKKEEL